MKRIIRNDDGTSRDKSRANLGKSAEEIVRAALDKRKATDVQFDFQRLYDAHTAGGFFPAQIADFLFFGVDVERECYHGAIEVKEVKHDFRLPAKNFPAKKLQALKRRQQAGGEILIFVRFMPSGLGRIVPLDFLIDAGEVPSWDLQEFETTNFSELLKECI